MPDALDPDPARTADIERLLAPGIRALGEPTALSPLRYDLGAGVPDRATLPSGDLADAVARVLRSRPADALTYGGARGSPALRTWIATREGARAGLALTGEHVTLCSGSAHAIDNIAATFVGPGDVVVVPAPTYPGAVRTFRARGARLLDVPQDREGLVVERLAEVLQQLEAEGTRAKLVYVIANYDNPSGSTLAPERRAEVVRLAVEHGALLVEDDAYEGLDFEGAPPPSLFALAGGRGVMRVGTFSKTVATGLRAGWILAEPAIVERLAFARFDNGSPPFVQQALLEYLRSGAYEPHLRQIRALYRERRDVAVAALREHLGELATFEVPRGGFVLWLRLAAGLDAASVVAAAARHDVAITPGTNYYATEASRAEGERRVRLVYSALPPRELEAAIAALGAAVRELAGAATAER